MTMARTVSSSCAASSAAWGEPSLFSGLQRKREGRTGTAAMALVDVRLARAFLEEAQVADLFNFRVALQEIAHLGGVLAGAAHAKLECLEAPQQHPCRVRVA